jgi:hypothetical protein
MSNGSIGYYVKIRGRTLGPFTPDRLRQMAQQGQLSRINLISQDGQDWIKAGEVPAFFEGAKQQPQERIEPTSEPITSPNQVKPEWHYALGAEQHGPVTFGQVRGLVANQTLGAGDLVWKEGMSDWEPVSSIAELAASLPKREEPERRKRTRRDRETRDSSASVDLSASRDIIRSGSSWAFFITIATYVFAGFIFFLSIAGLIVGAKQQQGVVVAQAVINLLFGGVITTAAIFLNRYSSHASRFCVSGDTDDLNQSLRWLSRLWLFIGICLIFILALTLITVIYGLAIGADLSRYSPY